MSRDPSTLTDDDLPTMTDLEAADYYFANRHRLDEIFDGEPVEFVVSSNLRVAGGAS